MADKRVATVVNRERLEPSGAQDLARRAEALAKRVARERLDDPTGDQRGKERLVGAGALPQPLVLSLGEVLERPHVARAISEARRSSGCPTGGVVDAFPYL
jgi:hypothetical protein